MSMLPADTHRRLGVVLQVVPIDPKVLLDRFVKVLPNLVLRAPPFNIPDAERLALLHKLQHWLAVTVALDEMAQRRRLVEAAMLPDLLAASEAAEPPGDCP